MTQATVVALCDAHSPCRRVKYVSFSTSERGGLLRGGQLSDGRRVAVVRVVFRYLDQARAELRPLRDNGIEVQAYGADGTLVAVTQP